MIKKFTYLVFLASFYSSYTFGAADTTIKGTTSDATAASLQVTNSSDAILFFARNDGNIGVGDATPASLFTVGSGDPYQVDSSGDVVKLKNVSYVWPSSQGAVSTFLKNNGSGILTWETVAAGSSSLSGLTAATAANTIANGVNAQAWNWALAATGNTGLSLGETTAATTGGTVLGLNTLATSTAVPLSVNNLGAADSFVVNDQGSDTTPFIIDATGNAGIGDATPDAKLEVLSTTEQFRLTHTDGTVDSRFTVDSSGNLTIDNTGTKTAIADDLQVTGNDLLDSAAATRLTLGATNIATGNLSATGTLSTGTASTTTGSVAFNNSANANAITIQSGATSASHTLTLPISQGAASTFLKNNGSGALSWDSVSSASSAYATKTTNYTITSSDDIIAGDASGGAITITLPTAVGIAGRLFTVKRINSGSNNVTVATTSSQTIDGDTTQVLVLQYTSIDVVSDGSNWIIT